MATRNGYKKISASECNNYQKYPLGTVYLFSGEWYFRSWK